MSAPNLSRQKPFRKKRRSRRRDVTPPDLARAWRRAIGSGAPLDEIATLVDVKHGRAHRRLCEALEALAEEAGR